MGILAAGAFVLIAALETWQQRTSPHQSADRWRTNLSLFGLEQLLMYASGGWLAGVAASLAGPSPLAAVHGGWSEWLRVGFAVGALDAAAYATHVLSHHLGPLWRLHAVHHADRALDVTTTIRHHPFEAVPTVAALGACTWLFGFTAADLAAYGALAFVVQTIAHADLRLPHQLMCYAGLLFVTPDQHTLHHSRHVPQTNSNYGQVLSVWDRVFGTLSHHEAAEPIAIGLDTYASDRFQGVLGALAQPFRKPDAAPADQRQFAHPAA